LGNATDAHAAHIKNALTESGATVNYFDTSFFPTKTRISFSPDTLNGSLTLPGGSKLKLQDIHSVYWRSFSGIKVPTLQDSNQQQVAFNDSMSTVRSLIQACPAKWINSWKAYQFHQEKPLQLAKAKQIGVTIPATLITNNADDIREFFQAHEKVIFKPVYGGAHTQFVTEQHLNSQRLNQVLSISPVTIQEYILGTNIRSYVIRKSVYAAEIRSQTLDFREDAKAELFPIYLPGSIQEQCLAITKELMLEWTAINWRVKPNGEYVFLEANPSPMFIHFEQQTGFPITQQLIKLLMDNNWKSKY
jgi:glutathione synthase/RimK-type ligase-like ATP-grasp enzyme